MLRTGKVVQKNGEDLEVCFERPEMCAHCGACSGQHVHEETVRIEGKANVGDKVTVEMPDSKIVKVSLIAYVIPLVGLMCGLMIGQTFLKKDVWAAVTGILGLAGGLVVTRLLDRRLGQKAGWKPKLLYVNESDIINKEETV